MAHNAKIQLEGSELRPSVFRGNLYLTFTDLCGDGSITVPYCKKATDLGFFVGLKNFLEDTEQKKLKKTPVFKNSKKERVWIEHAVCDGDEEDEVDGGDQLQIHQGGFRVHKESDTGEIVGTVYITTNDAKALLKGDVKERIRKVLFKHQKEKAAGKK